MLNHARKLLAVVVLILGPATTPSAVAAADGDRSATLLSAFFGLDNGLPFRANALCLGASGQDGMPVVLSHPIDANSLQAEDFQVLTRSGARRTPRCVTTRPANDPGELRTVLLIGEFGNADDDPPVAVHIVGDLRSAGSGPNSEQANFLGSKTRVIPLSAGPSLVFAETVPVNRLATDSRGTTCPEGVQQAVRVTWSGGVRLPNRDEPGEPERKLYRVTISRKSGSNDDIAPWALADLGDGDNNHLLCLDTSDSAISVSFPAGHLIDPNQDLNPATQVAVRPVQK